MTVVIVPDWVSEIADRHVESIHDGVPRTVAVQMACMEAVAFESRRVADELERYAATAEHMTAAARAAYGPIVEGLRGRADSLDPEGAHRG